MIINRNGEDEVAGRKCNVYGIAVKVVNFEQIYRFAVDQDTYICLGWESEKIFRDLKKQGKGVLPALVLKQRGLIWKKNF